MRVALVSDTHLPRFGQVLPRALVEGFAAAGISRIVHAGDWTDPLAVTLLEALAPVDGVAGNNDGQALHERFGTRRIFALDGVRIGLTHGHLGPGQTTPGRARRAFEGEALDAIVFGHSHIPLVERLPGGAWLVNPGSPTDRRRQATYSWALLRIADGAITSMELVRFGDRSP
ncbi:MAG TPA: metallophosphoesterase [Candidatus Limnocylindrales bacterium]